MSTIPARLRINQWIIHKWCTDRFSKILPIEKGGRFKIWCINKGVCTTRSMNLLRWSLAHEIFLVTVKHKML